MTGQQLKNSILQMAVQGKLVPQDPNDEPASVLLERIRAEKEQLIKEGKIKKEKNPSVIFRGADNLPYEKVGKNEPVCIADEVPFDIPESWEWVRLKDIVVKEIKRGKSPTYADNSSILVFAQKCNTKAGIIDLSPAKHLDFKSFAKYPDDEYMQDGDIVVNSTGNGTLGRVGVFHDADRSNDCVIVPDSHVTTIRINKILVLDYVYYVLVYYQPYFEKNCSGSTNQTELKPLVIANLFIPVPPIEEQRRIIRKLSSVLPLVTRYDEKEAALEVYNTAFPAQLKKSILQYAVQGKLVPQDPADEPASVLLEHIRAEKEQLVKAGRIKRDKHESVIFRRDNSYYEKVDGIERCIDDELPFEIPESWEWCRLKSLTENITSGSRDWAKYYSTTGAAFLRMGNLSKNSFDLRLEHIQRVSIPSKAEGTRTSLQSGDLLFSITGDVGMLGLIPDGFEKAYVNQHTAMIRFLPEMRNKYIPYLLLTDYAQKFYNANQHGIKNSFRLDSIGELLVSIPPEKELFRILQRISLVLSKIAVL